MTRMVQNRTNQFRHSISCKRSSKKKDESPCRMAQGNLNQNSSQIEQLNPKLFASRAAQYDEHMPEPTPIQVAFVGWQCATRIGFVTDFEGSPKEQLERVTACAGWQRPSNSIPNSLHIEQLNTMQTCWNQCLSKSPLCNNNS